MKGRKNRNLIYVALNQPIVLYNYESDQHRRDKMYTPLVVIMFILLTAQALIEIGVLHH
ncbi:hypothetical protein FBBNIHIM_04130 [Pseudocitrobacter vendiensis]|uniref:Uncharacterized protein n=1 Tax=Pseudocitrobacter vendiensis TaxID=2488306 RepID=A0ABN8T6X5_9ENTR|nr:hypothetical protein FBBNIHIM_04130 [Pseudocitrobacter vendiensis]